MNLDRFLEKQIYRILFEQADDDIERTGAKARGRSKKAIEDTKKSALESPRKLMQALGVGGVSGKNNLEKMFNLLEQAQSGADPMQQAYGKPTAHKHKQSGREGVRVPYSVIDAKAARRYLEYTLIGAIGATVVKFDNAGQSGDGLKGIQVEPLGNDILIYFAPSPNSWHKKGKGKPKPKEKEEVAEDETT